MQLLSRTSPSPAAKLLLIFFWCEIITIQFLLCSSCSSGVSYSFGIGSAGTGILSSFGNTFVVVTGSAPLLFTLLCMTFKDINSMSLPTSKLKKLQSVFRPGSVKGGQGKKSSEKRKDKKKIKKARRIKYSGGSRGDSDEDYDDEYEKSKGNNFSPKRSSASKIKKNDRIANSIKHRNGVNPALHTLYGKLLRIDKHAFPTTPFSVYTSTKAVRKDKRKSNRQGKNANELPISSIEITSNNFIGGPYMNKNEEEALRLKILAKVKELDPLMCIPKVLCGYSSRQKRRKNNSSTKPTTSTTTTTTKRPFYLDELLIDEYLQMLKIVPSEKEKDEKKKKKGKGRQKDSSENERINKSEENVSEDDEDEDVANKDNDSASASSESNESIEQHQRYPMKPQRNRQMEWERNRQREWERNREREKQHKLKWLFNRNKSNEDDDDDDDDDENNDDEPEDDLAEDMTFDDEEMSYLVERAKMQKLMTTSGAYSDEDWWDAFETPKPHYTPYPQKPPYDPLGPNYDPMGTASTYDLLKTDDETNGGVTGWFTNMIGNFMPRISWNGVLGGHKDEEFKNDPFFTSFDGRSLKSGGFGRESRGFFTSVGTTTTASTKVSDVKNKNRLANVPTSPVPALKADRSKNGRRLDMDKILGKVNLRHSQTTEDDQRDPAEKYRVAVEVGKRVASPSQCGFIYNGCPLSYEEILAIINEPLKDLMNPTKSTTAGTTSAATTTTPFPTTKRIGSKATIQYAITIPSSTSQVMMMPMQHQTYHPYPHQQNVLYQQRPQPTQHHQQIYNNQHHFNQHFQQQQLQQQLQYLQQSLQPQQNQQFLQQQYHIIQPQPPSTSPLDSLTEQWGKKSTNKPHKTRIHQDLPSGELEINLLYSDKKRKSGLEDEDLVPLNDINDSEYTEGVEDHGGENILPSVSSSSAGSSSGSASAGYEDPMQNQNPSDPFNHKLLGNKKHQSLPSSRVPSQGYKIKKKNKEKEGIKKVDNISRKDMAKRHFKPDSESEEWNNNMIEVDMNRSPGSKPGNLRRRADIVIRQQRPMHNEHPFHGNGIDTYGKYNPISKVSKDTSSLASFTPPLHLSSSPSFSSEETDLFHPHKERFQNKKNRNDNDMMISSKRKKKRKRVMTRERQKEHDDNESSSSNSGGTSSSSNEHKKHSVNQSEDDEELDNGEQNDDHHLKRKKKKKGKYNQVHLNKQSSESTEQKKRVPIPPTAPSPNAIYSLYGHPFSPSYVSYYSPTPTSSSFFSYFFGR